MPTNLNLDDEVTEASTVTGSATGWASRIITLIQRAFNSTENPFGSAATHDVGTAEGDLVALDSTGKIPDARLPLAGQGNSLGMVRFSTAAQVSNRLGGTALSPADLNLLNATTTAAGLVARAGATEISARSNVNKFCSPAEVATIAQAVGGSGGGGGTTLTADQLAILTHYPVPSLAVDDLLTAINSVSLVQVNNAWVLRVTYESLETAGAQTADWPLTPAALALLLSATDRTKLDRYPTPNRTLTRVITGHEPTILQFNSGQSRWELLTRYYTSDTTGVQTETFILDPATIATIYESVNDRNAFTNALRTKLINLEETPLANLQFAVGTQGGQTGSVFFTLSNGTEVSDFGNVFNYESAIVVPTSDQLTAGSSTDPALMSISNIVSLIHTHGLTPALNAKLGALPTIADDTYLLQDIVASRVANTNHLQIDKTFAHSVADTVADQITLTNVLKPPLVTQAEIDAATPSTTDERVVTPAILAGLRSSGGGGGGSGLQAVATLGEADESGPYVKFDGDGTATTPLGIQKGVLRRAIGAHADTGTFDDTATDRLVSGRALNTALNAKQNVLTNANVKTMYEANANTNAFTDADHTKLDGIESGATGDQTAAEIRALVNTASNSNVFTDADHTKLNSIETGATADQTDAEIKTAYENNADTNAFTDALKTRLEGVEDNAQANVGVEYTQAEKTKLDGIDDNATDDQTAAELRTSLGVLDAATINTGTETDGKLLSASVLKTAIETHGGGTGGGTATGDGYTRTSLGSGSPNIGTTWTSTEAELSNDNTYDDLEILLNYGTADSPDYTITRISVAEFFEIPSGTPNGSRTSSGGFIAVRGLAGGSNTGASIGRHQQTATQSAVLLAESAGNITAYQIYGIKYGAAPAPAAPTLQYQRVELYNGNLDFPGARLSQELVNTSNYTSYPLLEFNFHNSNMGALLPEHGAHIISSQAIVDIEVLQTTLGTGIYVDSNQNAALSYIALGYQVWYGRLANGNLWMASNNSSHDPWPLIIYGLNWVLS